jgi:hypothetical protein
MYYLSELTCRAESVVPLLINDYVFNCYANIVEMMIYRAVPAPLPPALEHASQNARSQKHTKTLTLRPVAIIEGLKNFVDNILNFFLRF